MSRIVDSTEANAIAVALNQWFDALDSLRTCPAVGDAYIAQLRAREQAEKAFRDAFREATGWTLYRKAGRWHVRR